MTALNKVAQGNTAEIFEAGSGRVLKLFKLGYSRGAVEREYRNHRMVEGLVRNVPKLYEYVEMDQRLGFVMERVRGESLAVGMLDERTFQQAMEVFVKLHKEWLSKTLDGAVPYTQWMRDCLGDGREDSGLMDQIAGLPQGNCLCHGDFHPYNIILSSAWEPVVIDFANVCRAPKEYDVARTWYLLKEAGAEKPADLYLEKMGVAKSSLQAYIAVIGQLRKYKL